MTKTKKSRRQMEQEESLAKEARLAYVGRLTTGLVHEIRTPLNAIQLNTQLLREEAGRMPEIQREPWVRRLERIATEVESLSETLDEFIAFARPPKMAAVPTDIRDFLERTVDFIRPACEKQGVKIVTEIADTLYPVRVDPKQLSQVILNLTENALQAIGSVKRPAGKKQNGKQHGRIRICVTEQEQDVLIRVEDNGGGVPPELEERIFDEFFTTREQGTGLGLVIARRIVEEHGGSLTLDNKPGLGATFAIRLPRARIIDYDATTAVRSEK